jgi:two-component system sensor histidine kinase DegS
MIQEALSNVTKHAKATLVKVQLTMKNEKLIASITDNGTGFDMDAVSLDPEKLDHFGLQGMKERARMLYGEINWKSEKGKGTCVTIQVPIAL